MKAASLKMPRPNQPVRVRVLYTNAGVVERWLTFPNIREYFDRLLTRYPPRQPFPHENEPRPFLRRRFTIMEVTWKGK